MLLSLSLLLIGFSIFSALLLAVTHFRAESYREHTSARWAGLALLGVLAGVQWAHFAYLQHGSDVIHGPLYRMLLFLVAPCFFLFSRPLLLGVSGLQARDGWHLLPVCVAGFMPFAWALPCSFALGAVYLLWLARSLYALRVERSRFRLELIILGGVFVIAVAVMVLGLALPWVPERLFFSWYAAAIGCAFLLVNAVLGYAPQLPEAVAEVARDTYAVSTLLNIDCDAVLQRLEQLMGGERAYQDAELDLQGLAERLGLSPHQLSELINTRLGKGFSRYVREYRVEAACVLLKDKPSVAVLAVGLSVGFTSQSTFYEAFREITGTTPGQYRKLQRRPT